MASVLSNLILVSALLFCLYTDVKERRIYNKITFTLIITGFVLSFLSYGLAGVLFSLKGLLLGLGLLFIPFALGGIGAGDVKLIMAIGAVKGAAFVFQATILTFLAGGVIALVILIKKRILFSTVKEIWTNLSILFIGKFKPGLIQGVNQSSKITFPYGIAIFSGTIATLLVV